MKLGAIVDSPGYNQKNYEIITQMNKLGNLDFYLDFIMFYVEHDNIMVSPSFSMMDAVEIYGFNAPVIATNLYTADILLKAHGPIRKFLYMWDLEWTYKIWDIDKLANIYLNEELELIARSEEHSEIITKYWKKPVTTIEDFDYAKIASLTN